MMTFTDLASIPSNDSAPFIDQPRLAVAAYLARFTGSSREHTDQTCAATCPGAPSEAWTRWPPAARTWSCTSGGCRRSATSSPPRCRGGSQSWPVSTGSVLSTACSNTHPPSTSAGHQCPRSHPRSRSPTCNSKPSSPPAASHRTPCDFALVAMLGLLGLRIFEAIGADITDLGEEHGHRVLRVCGKGTKVVLIPLPPAVGRAIDWAAGTRNCGPILLNSHGARMDRHAATRRLRRLADAAGVQITRAHPHMLRHTFVTTMLDAGVDLRDVQIAARHADPRTTMRSDRAPPLLRSTAGDARHCR